VGSRVGASAPARREISRSRLRALPRGDLLAAADDPAESGRVLLGFAIFGEARARSSSSGWWPVLAGRGQRGGGAAGASWSAGIS